MPSFLHRYELQQQLGVGATAEVYQIMHKASKHTYAAKIINKKRMSPNQLGDLENEIAVMRELNHPSIVHLKESKDEGDKVYLVMEELHGGELFDRIIDLGSFKEKEAKEIFFNIACAVAYIHHKGVVHRDLKPENILLKNHAKGEAHNLVLCDFGVSATLPKRFANQSSQKVEQAQPFSRVCGSPEVRANCCIGGLAVGRNYDLGGSVQSYCVRSIVLCSVTCVHFFFSCFCFCPCCNLSVCTCGFHSTWPPKSYVPTKQHEKAMDLNAMFGVWV